MSRRAGVGWKGEKDGCIVGRWLSPPPPPPHFLNGRLSPHAAAGTDVTIVTFSRMVGYSLEAAKALEKEGVSVEVINLRYVCVFYLICMYYPI